jgi:hypothetical protein
MGTKIHESAAEYTAAIVNMIAGGELFATYAAKSVNLRSRVGGGLWYKLADSGVLTYWYNGDESTVMIGRRNRGLIVAAVAAAAASTPETDSALLAAAAAANDPETAAAITAELGYDPAAALAVLARSEETAAKLSPALAAELIAVTMAVVRTVAATEETASTPETAGELPLMATVSELESWMLISVDSDIAATLAHIGRGDYSAGFLLVLPETDSNGDMVDYAAVYGSESSVPYNSRLCELLYPSPAVSSGDGQDGDGDGDGDDSETDDPDYGDGPPPGSELLIDDHHGTYSGQILGQIIAADRQNWHNVAADDLANLADRDSEYYDESAVAIADNAYYVDPATGVVWRLYWADGGLWIYPTEETAAELAAESERIAAYRRTADIFGRHMQSTLTHATMATYETAAAALGTAVRGYRDISADGGGQFYDPETVRQQFAAAAADDIAVAANKVWRFYPEYGDPAFMAELGTVPEDSRANKLAELGIVSGSFYGRRLFITAAEYEEFGRELDSAAAAAELAAQRRLNGDDSDSMVCSECGDDPDSCQCQDGDGE